MASPRKVDSKRGLTRPSAILILILSGLLLLVIGQEFFTKQDAVEPHLLRIGVLPDQDPEALQQRFAPVLEYLSTTLQIPCELRVPDSYSHLLELYQNDEIDLAYFGGYSFIKARQDNQALPVVMRRIDIRFTSLFLVPANSEARKLEDLNGERMGFGSRLSTSGHLMPRYFLAQRGIDPEDYFSHIEYTGAHDKTILWVRDGKIDVGAVNANTYHSMLDRKLIGADEVRVLWETPPYADYIWAVKPELGETMRIKIRDAFLDLSPEVEGHEEILNQLNASGYIPVNPEYYSNLASIVNQFEATVTSDRDRKD